MLETFSGRTLFLLFSVYFSQGFRQFGYFATSLYLKLSFGMEFSENQLIQTMILLAWNIKPIYGLISDNFPIFGFHRCGYLFLSATIGTISFMTFFFIQNLTASIIALIISELSQAIADVMADAIVVQESRKTHIEGSDYLQSFCWFWLALGAITGGLLGGFSLNFLSPNNAIGVQVICPILIMIATFLYPEQKSTDHSSCSSFCYKLRRLFKLWSKPIVFKVMIFNFLNRATVPSFSMLMFYFYFDKVGFSKEFTSALTTISFIGLACGSFVYAKFFTKIAFKKLMFWGLIFITFFSMIDFLLIFGVYKDIGIKAEYIAVFSTFIGNIADFTIRMMPTLVIASLLCPNGSEATLFTLFNSSNNIGISVSSLLGPMIANTLGIYNANNPNIWILFVIGSLSNLILVLFLFLIPESREKCSVEDEKLAQPLLKN
ncbi:unnamed protein product [Blepharisma stoltei]|uniref:Uncharacterized protein n=1 Tax=Blepharisma stoltei TaxID=1481888 RepID=A0AAU9IYQ8_9CILI|nr:unnamed protein product [Blepharisma stoltei]